MAKIHVTAKLNGNDVEFLCETRQTLLQILRDELHLTGTKEGCATGDCGACSVTVDGRLICSCLILGAEVQGKSIRTIEGMAEGSELHPLQDTFADLGAAQCGYCSPGFLLVAKELIEKSPKPSRDEIKEALSGNLCRCTGYIKIYEAVELAAARMRGETAELPRESVYGRQ